MIWFLREAEDGSLDYSQGATRARQSPTDHEISDQDWQDHVVAIAPMPPTIQDWEGFREALYANPEFRAARRTTPLFAELIVLLWERQFHLAALTWADLKEENLISAELEQFVATAAIKAGLGKELAIVTGA